MTTLEIINYGVMTIFFFVVGLEIKRELTSGHLTTLRKAAAPFLAAIGGMAVPAIIYLAIAGRTAPEGWAIPVATDIALAVGLLVLMGARATESLKTFLLALAVIDDIGAIIIIALVFTAGAVISWLFAAIGAIVIVLLLQRFKAIKTFPYIAIGLLLWFTLFKAGLHPTLAGVVMGLLTPVKEITRLEEKLHRVSAYFVVPLFAFANSGISLSSKTLNLAFTSPIAWGIIVGLVIGKPLGVFAAATGAARVQIVQLPAETTRSSLLAVGSTAGIGFTVAIFIAKLAFTDRALADLAVIAVMAGSIISGLIGVALFRLVRP